MKIDIPEWLIEMSRQMNTDPNRCTSHPYWQVRNKTYIPTENGYSDHHWVVYDSDDCREVYRSDKSEDFSELAGVLFESEEAWCKAFMEDCDELIFGFKEHLFLDAFDSGFEPDYHELPYRFRLIYMQEVEEVVSTHLTQSDAEWFIERKKHDYPNAYTYVASAVWSPQLIKLQGWIKSLSDKGQENEPD